LLLQNGIESYCPTTMVTKQWSDRVKKVEQPLFTSYVFVKVSNEQQTQVRAITNVVNFVYWQGKPAKINEAEIQAIKNFIGTNTNITVEKTSQKPGDKIKIEEGVFKGHTAIIKKIGKHKIELILPLLQAKLVASIK
jgi:transcription antitermination factor NusG